MDALFKIETIPFLIPNQKRVRHLQYIFIRNLTLQTKHVPLSYFVYFTLHSDLYSEAFFKSDIISYSRNPFWMNLELNKIENLLYLNLNRLIIRIWICHDDTLITERDHNNQLIVDNITKNPCNFITDDKMIFCMNQNNSNIKIDFQNLKKNKFVIIKWDVEFSALQLINEKIFSENYEGPPNRIIFVIKDKMYSSDCSKNCTEKILPYLKHEKYEFNRSYMFTQIIRLNTISKALRQLLHRVNNSKVQINHIINEKISLISKTTEVEQRRCHIDILKKTVARRKERLLRLYEELQFKKNQNFKLKSKLEIENNEFNQFWNIFDEFKKKYFDSREELWNFGSQLINRRKQLLSDLAFIYPIEKEEINGKSTYKICNVTLPYSENLDKMDETSLSVALGSSCHLIKMISVFLDLPLRYNIDYQGSRSTIRDDLIERLPENDRIFPLFFKGNDKYFVNYGLFILNKNIAQLRHYCGMPTQNLSYTLANILSLMCEKLGVTNLENSAFLNQHAHVPSSFAGPQIRNTVNRIAESSDYKTTANVDTNMRSINIKTENLQKKINVENINTKFIQTEITENESTENKNTKIIEIEYTTNEDIKTQNTKIGIKNTDNLLTNMNIIKNITSEHIITENKTTDIKKAENCHKEILQNNIVKNCFTNSISSHHLSNNQTNVLCENILDKISNIDEDNVIFVDNSTNIPCFNDNLNIEINLHECSDLKLPINYNSITEMDKNIENSFIKSKNNNLANLNSTNDILISSKNHDSVEKNYLMFEHEKNCKFLEKDYSTEDNSNITSNNLEYNYSNIEPNSVTILQNINSLDNNAYEVDKKNLNDHKVKLYSENGLNIYESDFKVKTDNYSIKNKLKGGCISDVESHSLSYKNSCNYCSKVSGDFLNKNSVGVILDCKLDDDVTCNESDRPSSLESQYEASSSICEGDLNNTNQSEIVNVSEDNFSDISGTLMPHSRKEGIEYKLRSMMLQNICSTPDTYLSSASDEDE